jgi:predicted transcriptional regulator
LTSTGKWQNISTWQLVARWHFAAPTRENDMGKRQAVDSLGGRERQIMEAVHRLGEATVNDVLAQLADPPSYSAVRTMIRHLESKGLLSHRQDGKRYVYKPTQSRESASKSALRKLLDVFFAGSVTDAVAAILDVSSDQLDAADFDRMAKLIRQAKAEGK